MAHFDLFASLETLASQQKAQVGGRIKVVKGYKATKTGKVRAVYATLASNPIERAPDLRDDDALADFLSSEDTKISTFRKTEQVGHAMRETPFALTCEGAGALVNAAVNSVNVGDDRDDDRDDDVSANNRVVGEIVS